MQSKYMSSYINKIKLIYIAPPYNTRKSKTYQDNLELCVWENEISTVLMSLYSYLKQDGVIFISIDDNEYAQLKLLCDRIFGRNNFAGTFITRQAQRSNSRLINTVHEYIICYARDITKLPRFSIRRIKIPEQKNMINDIMTKVKSEMPHGIKRAESRLHGLIKDYCRRYSITWLKNYNCVDARGNVYFAADLSVPGMPRAVEIEKIGLHLEPLQTRGWVSDKKFIELHEKKLLVYRNGRPYQKKYLVDAEDNAPSILNFYSRFGTKDLERLGLKDIFDTPKPVELIKFLIRIAGLAKDDYVLDCYGGSGTTGQAVLEINQEDGSDIGFILIQKKEMVAKNSKAFKICLKFHIEPDISEIIKLRLARVCEKLKSGDNIEYIEKL